MARREDDKIVRTLKKRAETDSQGVEHRAKRARPGAFAKVLASMPNVGLDSDFERVDSTERFADMSD